MKKIILFLIFTLFLINPTFAENFYIDQYNVKINVSPTNTMDIEEQIKVVFKGGAHGIFRTIPLVNHVRRQDGTSYKNKARVENVRVNDNFRNIREGDNLKIQIGTRGKYVYGSKMYIIKYKYILSQNAKNQDEFYFNIIGNDWNVRINNANFNVIMPKEFDNNKVGISIGRRGTAGFTNRARFGIKDKLIFGSTTEPLMPREGITMRVELPKNYFQYSVSKSKAGSIFLTIILTLLSIIIWSVLGKDTLTIPVVNFAPPKGLDAPKTGAIFKELVDDEIISVLMLHLASKGYIKIEEEKSLVSFYKNYTIYKLKDYDKKDKEIIDIFNEMFSYSNYISTRDLAKSKTFPMLIRNYKNSVNKFKDRIYEQDSISIKNRFFPFVSMIILLINTIYVAFDYDKSLVFTQTSLLLGLSLVIFAIVLTRIHKIPTLPKKIAAIFGGIVFSGIFAYLFFLRTDFSPISDIGTFIFAIAGFIITFICFKEMPKKSQEGQKILGHILGFRKFLETVEKHKLELIMKQKPNYCYSVIPYAFALDIGGDWIKKIQPLAKCPAWFVGEYNENNLKNFNRSFSCSIIATGGNVTSSSGGGGFSGGGSGGGGGGSW